MPGLGADGQLLPLPQGAPASSENYKKVPNAEALIWKILMIAEKKFRRLNAPHLLEEVYKGRKFVDGVAVKKVNGRLAA